MAGDFDLVVRRGTLIDGSGADGFCADIGILNGCITAIGDIEASDAAEIDARGCIVTPGFVDIHTHYDGQATWEHRMSPSSAHGVTTVVTGNCGVGFAPCRPADRERLVALMEGVEDVPEIVMTKGLPWTWESFPEFLDVLEGRQFDVDIATQVPHSCIRVFVMGERGASLETATEADLLKMTEVTAQALRAGAIGVSTSRSIFHRFRDGRPVPTKEAAEAELHAIGRGISQAGHGVIEALIDQDRLDTEFGIMCRVAQQAGAPMSLTLVQIDTAPEGWKQMLALIENANDDGIRIKGQVIGRPMGILMGLDLSLNPFSLYPSYKAIADLPLNEKVAIMRQADFRARIMAEQPGEITHPVEAYISKFDMLYALGDPPCYNPQPDQSIAGLAAQSGRPPLDVAYDLLLEKGGAAMLFSAATNYADQTLNSLLGMLQHQHTILGLGDGGAHYGMICDAGYPTFMLTYWARDRAGERLGLPQVVRALAYEPSRAVGLNDRGLIALGQRADLNIIDHDHLTLHAPRVNRDLPGGGRRIAQSASGYRATLVNGQVTYRDGAPTGALPGRLVRGPQKAAHAEY